ncbi:hypothetical protein RSOLAG22IIIB_11301 [Rhizoctonia solani]|uniref:Uncharacterized protein n=1 Tax=Rhizoctonia solani TaxID=456999 RepID=A0A0K6G7W6_9AGAM|nr:hypothetical protein RSOLAG22IIIB_11301 [Rhizoctonia solani]
MSALNPIRSASKYQRWVVLSPRATVGAGTDSASRSLIIVGITCGTLAAVVLVGIIVYLVIRHRRDSTNEIRHRRHRNSVPVSSRIRNGYTRTRGSSNSTAASGEQAKVMGEVPQGYFKSWSARSKNAYLSLPFMGMASSDNLAQTHARSTNQLYDPESAARLPPPSKNKTNKSTRERLRLDTSLIAPSPKLSNFPSPTQHARSPRHRSSTLMKSATSPPPTAKFFTQPPRLNGVGKPIRPRAELRVGDASPRARGGGSGFAGLGSFIPPPPPSWASFWPTESGWTGPGGEPSIRDEDFGSESGEGLEEKKARMDSGEYDSDPEKVHLHHSDSENEEVQYALDKRPEEGYVVGSFRLTPMALRGNGNARGSMEDVRTPLSDGTASQFPVSSPPRISTEIGSPKLDYGEDVTCQPESPTLARAATGRLTLAFGSKSTLSDKAQRSNTKSSSRSAKTNRSGRSNGHSRNTSSTHLSVARSGTRVTRSSTIRTERSDWTDQGSPISTVSGHILSALTGHVATPLLRSMESLRRVGSGYLGQQHEDDGASEAPTTEQGSPSDSSPRHAPVRRLPDVPPVPPIPRHYTTEPRPLPVPSASLPPPPPVLPVIPRSASMNLVTDSKDEMFARPVSIGAVPSTIRPLPTVPSSTL